MTCLRLMTMGGSGYGEPQGHALTMVTEFRRACLSVGWARLNGPCSNNGLLAAVSPATASVRFYFLDADVKVEHYGANLPVDMDGPLVV